MPIWINADTPSVSELLASKIYISKIQIYILRRSVANWNFHIYIWKYKIYIHLRSLANRASQIIFSSSSVGRNFDYSLVRGIKQSWSCINTEEHHHVKLITGCIFSNRRPTRNHTSEEKYIWKHDNGKEPHRREKYTFHTQRKK
jgi:hypothetical protein